MFDFLKKNKPKQMETVKEKISAESAPFQKGPTEADNVTIHVMPERFRHQAVKQDSAKTMGLLIIIGGAVVLVAAGAALYYFLLKKPNLAVSQKPPVAAENNQPAVEPTAKVPETQIATGTETATLPTGAETATITVATSTIETTPLETGPSLRVGADSDNDGLTDSEETFFGTASTTPDTDGDGYVDGAELINLYNPAGVGKLIANSRISLYQNKTFAYDLLYPSSWQTSVNGGDDSLMFKTGDNQFVQVIVQPNAGKQTFDQWYMEQLDASTISEADRVSGANWQGIKSPDGLNIYLTDKKQNYIFSLTYNPGGANILEYFNIFQMMVKSFTLKE